MKRQHYKYYFNDSTKYLLYVHLLNSNARKETSYAHKHYETYWQ